MENHVKWNEIVYGDALAFLRSLQDKSIDLGFADPPFNIDLEKNKNDGIAYHEKKNVETIFYDDTLTPEEYEHWCCDWLRELLRVCRKVLVYCGTMNMAMFCRIKEPMDTIIYFMKFNTVITPSAWAGRFRPILVYAENKKSFSGNPKGENCKFDSSVIVKSKRFYNQKEEDDRKVLIHPCPIDRELMYQILLQMKPDSFFDPFAGSGTTLYVASRLGIKWMAVEKDARYKLDHGYLLHGKAGRMMRQIKLFIS